MLKLSKISQTNLSWIKEGWAGGDGGKETVTSVVTHLPVVNLCMRTGRPVVEDCHIDPFINRK